MDEELLNDWKKLRLTDEEEVVLGGDYVETVTDDTKKQIQLTLVGKLWAVKPYNLEAMKRTLTNVWRLKEKFAVRVVETNLFVFQFFGIEDKERVMEGRPWFFDEKLLLLQEVQGDEQPSEITFKNTPMWVRLMDVPFNKRLVAVMYDVGEFLGGFMEMDESDPIGWGECMRIKILVDINKPLRRGLFLAMGQKKSRWIDIKMVFQYGPWLRASPKKRSKTEAGEREIERAWVDRLRSTCNATKKASYNDPEVIKLGPVSAARRLIFPSANKKGNVTKEWPAQSREAKVMRVRKGEGEMVVLRTIRLRRGEGDDAVEEERVTVNKKEGQAGEEKEGDMEKKEEISVGEGEVELLMTETIFKAVQEVKVNDLTEGNAEV
uniref:DUF4283 domain-containing protein n=1 Tax=Chenopodium quinoa TaxID=63459 RepID=A0A803L1E7_CHEQI